MSGSTARVIEAGDIATALGGPGTAGQVVGTNGTTPQWINAPIGSIALAAVTGNNQFVTLPAGAVILQVTLQETAGVAVSVTLGTTAGASDILQATPLSANELLAAPQISLSKAAFAASQAVYISSTAWNGASVNMKVWYAV